jgi:hypothetical protein
MKILIMQFAPASGFCTLLRSKYSSRNFFSNAFSLCSSLMSETRFNTHTKLHAKFMILYILNFTFMIKIVIVTVVPHYFNFATFSIYLLVGIATGYGLDDRGVRVRDPVGSRIFLFFTSSRPALGSTQPPIQWVPGALFPGIKWPGRESNRSPSASAEVKKMWIYTSSPPYAFMS